MSLFVDSGAVVYGGRFFLDAYYSPEVVARVVVGVKLDGSSQAAQRNSSGVEPIPKQVVRDADRQLTKLERSPLINNEEISALRELVVAAKAQKRQ